MRKDFLIYVLAALFFVFCGCATYRAQPLGKGYAGKKMDTKTLTDVRVLAKSLSQPFSVPMRFDYDNGLSPDEAAVFSVLNNPMLRAARDEKKLASAQTIQAGTLPNPQISYSAGFPVGSGSNGRSTAADLGMSEDISSLISRRVRIRAAKENKASIDLGVAWKEWQVASAAKLATFRVVMGERRSRAADRRAHALFQAYGLVKHGVEIGVKTDAGLLNAQARLFDARISAMAAQSEVRAARLFLNRVLGLAPDQVVRVQAPARIKAVRKLPDQKTLVTDIERHRLDLAAMRLAYKSSDDALRAAVYKQFPAINIGLLGGKDTDRVRTLGIGISIGIPVFDRNQGAIAIKRADRKRLFDEYNARYFGAISDIARITQQLESTRKQVEEIEKAEAGLEQKAAYYKDAANRGAGNMIDYYNALADAGKKEGQLIDARLRAADLMVALEIASGRSNFCLQE